jgi:hypothetical protein
MGVFQNKKSHNTSLDFFSHIHDFFLALLKDALNNIC